MSFGNSRIHPVPCSRLQNILQTLRPVEDYFDCYKRKAKVGSLCCFLWERLPSLQRVSHLQEISRGLGICIYSIKIPDSKLNMILPEIWILRTFGDAGLNLSVGLHYSVFVQDTRSQQIKIGSPVHLPLQHFEPVYLPFYLSITPRRAKGLLHGALILL